MKKLMIVALAAVFCVAFAGPAMAKIEMYGGVAVDTFYWEASKESPQASNPKFGNITAGEPLDKLTRFEIDLPHPGNRIGMRYRSDDGKVFANIQIRHGFGNSKDRVESELAYFDYKFGGDLWKVRFGRQPQSFATAAPPFMVGGAAGPAGPQAIFLGLGNFHGGTSYDMVKFYIYPAENVRIEAALVDPGNKSGLALPQAGALGRLENTMPRFDASVNIKFGAIEVEPYFSWLQLEWDNTAAGFEDDYDSWGLGFTANASFGPLGLHTQLTYGENLVGQPGRVGFTGVPAGVFGGPLADPVNAFKLDDLEELHWWFWAGYKLGPGELRGGFGYSDYEYDENKRDVDVYAWSIAYWMPIAKGFFMYPMFRYHDFGDTDDDLVAANNTDNGDLWVLGIGWMLAF